MNDWLKLGIASVVAASLIGLYWLDEHRSQKAKESEKVETAALGFEQASARKVRLVLAGGTLVFERKDATSDWTLVEPAAGLKLEQSAVNNFVSSLAGLTSSMEIADTEKVLQGGDKSAFGLEKPVATVEVGLDSNVTKSLSVGADMEIGSRTGGTLESQAVYASNNARKQVFVISKPAVGFLKKTLADFRTKSATDFDVAAVESVSIAPAVGSKIVIAKVGAEWAIKSPRELPGDQSKIAAFVNSVAKLKVDKVTEKEMLSPSSMGAFGLDKPAAVLSFDGASGKNIAIVRFGKAKDAHYVQMADGAVGSVAAGAFAEVVPELKNLRDTRVMRDTKMSDIVKLRTGLGKVFQKEGASWYATDAIVLGDKGAIDSKSGVVSTPNTPGRVASAEAGTLFSDWEFMAAADVIEGSDLKAMSAYGLDKPKSRFAFLFADSKAAPEEILVGNHVPNEPKLVYVKRSNRAAVYLVDAGWLENLAKLDGAKAQPSK